MAASTTPNSVGCPATVRVIEYTVHTTAADGGEQTSEVFCLVTDLLDVEKYPALGLAWSGQSRDALHSARKRRIGMPAS